MSKSFSEECDTPKIFSIDKGMLKFKGRLGFIQYMPLKPVKCGVKVWMAAGSETGYVHAFDIYTAKNDYDIHEQYLDKNITK